MRTLLLCTVITALAGSGLAAGRRHPLQKRVGSPFTGDVSFEEYLRSQGVGFDSLFDGAEDEVPRAPQSRRRTSSAEPDPAARAPEYPYRDQPDPAARTPEYPYRQVEAALQAYAKGEQEPQVRYSEPQRPQSDSERQRPQYDSERQRPQYDSERQRPQYDSERQRPQYDSERQRPQYDSERQRPQYDSERQRPQYDGERQRLPAFNRSPYDSEDSQPSVYDNTLPTLFNRDIQKTALQNPRQASRYDSDDRKKPSYDSRETSYDSREPSLYDSDALIPRQPTPFERDDPFTRQSPFYNSDTTATRADAGVRPQSYTPVAPVKPAPIPYSQRRRTVIPLVAAPPSPDQSDLTRVSGVTQERLPAASRRQDFPDARDYVAPFSEPERVEFAPAYSQPQAEASPRQDGYALEIPHKREKQRLEFQVHGQQGPHSYRFGYDTGTGYNRQFRFEERDGYGNTKGRYGFYDKSGKLQVTNYSASPKGGFHAEGGFGKYPSPGH